MITAHTATLPTHKSQGTPRNRWSTASSKLNAYVPAFDAVGEKVLSAFSITTEYTPPDTRRHTVDASGFDPERYLTTASSSEGGGSSTVPTSPSIPPTTISITKPASFKSLFGTFRRKVRHRRKRSCSYDKVQRDSLKDICLDLGRIPDEEIPQREGAVFSPKTLTIGIKKVNIWITLDLPPATGTVTDNLKATATGDEEEQQHGGTCDMFIGMLPERCRAVSEKASPLGLVPKLLPYGLISKEARYVGSCFWIWLCIVDDLTEKVVGQEWAEIECDLYRVFSTNPHSKYNNIDNDVVRVSLALRQVIDFTTIVSTNNDPVKENHWRRTFMKAVCEIITGFRQERPLLETPSIPMAAWMHLRIVTISIRPFLILSRADLGLSPTVHRAGNPLETSLPTSLAFLTPLRKVEILLQLIMGLQNDILGWEKDAATENPLSAIQIEIAQGRSARVALAHTVHTHNELVKHCMKYAERVWEKPMDAECAYQHKRHGSLSTAGWKSRTATDNEAENVRRYLQLILGFANGMAMWMAVSKRYMV